MSSSRVRYYLVIVSIICLAGLFLRLYFFVINRSLWIDEAMLALNIVNRSFFGLLEPLDYNQAAPVGFLFLQKAVSSLIGISDRTLRIIPLVAGSFSVVIMYLVSRRYIGEPYALISLGLFVLSPNLIYYSSEVKQYATDVLMALVILLIIPKCLENKVDLRTFVIFGFLGIFAILLSHPSLFVFSAALLTVGLKFVMERDVYRFIWLFIVGLAYLIGLTLVYIVNLQYLESNENLASFWRDSFAPMPPWSNLRWYYDVMIRMLQNTASLPLSMIVAGLLICGTFSFALRRWQLMLFLLTPFLLTLVASSMRRYPFEGRLLLFLLPFLFLLLAEGVKVVGVILMRANKNLGKFVCASLAVYLLYGPAFIVYGNLRKPPMGEHIKPVMAYLSEKRLENDPIYVYYGAGPAFEFYAPLYGFTRSDYVMGISSRGEPAKYLEDIAKLGYNQRAWFVFSHNCSWCIVNEEEYILEYLSKIGVRRDEYLSEGASLYLYDLRYNP